MHGFNLEGVDRAGVALFVILSAFAPLSAILYFAHTL